MVSVEKRQDWFRDAQEDYYYYKEMKSELITVPIFLEVALSGRRVHSAWCFLRFQICVPFRLFVRPVPGKLRTGQSARRASTADYQRSKRLWTTPVSGSMMVPQNCLQQREN